MPRQIKIFIGIALAVIVLGALLFYAQPDGSGNSSQDNPATPSVLEVNEKIHDFGTVSMKNGNVTTVFRVKNNQAVAVYLNKIYTSCMCTKATLKLSGRSLGPFGMPGHDSIPTLESVLEPNQEAEVEVVFDPNAHGPAGVGLIERVVTLEGRQGLLATMDIKANVVP